jgi:hypothetical protein
MTMRIFEAGFDAAFITADVWESILTDHNVGLEPVAEEENWLWKGENGFIVSACNPITGKGVTEDGRYTQLNFAGAIGIEGPAEFVASAYVAINEQAQTKRESFGHRLFV